jgi:hypothetical protein
MKTINLFQKTLFITSLFALLSIQNLFAQAEAQQESTYAVVTCLKSMDKNAEGLLKDMALPYHKAAIKEKKELSWQYYEVEFPNGEDCNCDYMMVSIINTLQDLEFFIHPGPKVNMAKIAFPGKNPEVLINQWNKTFQNRGVQVYMLVDRVFQDNTPPSYISVNYMNVSELNARKYLHMETSIFKPLHQEAMQQGYLKSWSVFRRILPYGADFEGNFVTIDAWDSIEMMEKNFNQSSGIFEKVHPKKNVDQTMEKMLNARELYRSELWRYGLGTN